MTEDTPLLLRNPSSLTTINEGDPREQYRLPALFICFVAVFLVEIGVGVSIPAWSTLMERGLCSEMHPDIVDQLSPGQDNPFCKSPEVQGKLALIRGWTSTLELLPTFLLAMPYGFLSDKWGRKPVLLLSFFGVFLLTVWYEIVLFFQWPVWTVLLGSTFQLIGGGSPVGISMLFTTLADVVQAEDMASLLFRFLSVFLIAELVANSLSGYLLSYNPWLPLIVGNAAFVLCMTGITFLPETLIVRQWHDARAGRGCSQPDFLADDVTQSRLQKAVQLMQGNFNGVREFVLGNRRIVVLMLPLTFVDVGKYVSELLLQYATKRFGWTWSKAAYFLSIKSGSFVLFLTIILPIVSNFCLNVLKMSSLRKDLWLSRWCGVIHVLAYLTIAFSSTPWLFTCGLILSCGGTGLTATLRSVLNALVEPHHIGMLNTLLGLLETIGKMIAAPIFAETLHKGIKLGGAWIGLPFLCAAGISSLACVIIFALHVPDAEERHATAEDVA